MRTEIHRDSVAFQRLRPEWNALVQRSLCNRIFVTWEWQAIWWECLGEGELHLLTLRADDGLLVGIAPLCRVTGQTGERAFRWIGCVDVSDYLDLIALPEYEAALHKAILDYVTGPDAPAWDYVDLCNIPQDSHTHRALAELAVQRSLYARAEVQDVCPVISLPDTWDAYLDSLDKKQRHEIRRKMRRIEQETQTRRYTANNTNTLDDAVDTFIHLHKKSDPDKEAFMTVQMVQFFKEICRALFENGWLQLAFIEMDGVEAATMLNFDYNGEILVYNSGYDPSAYAGLSPGIVLLADCIRSAIESGRKRFDFLRGNEDYKFRFGAAATTVHNLLISPRPLP
jgi:CelD/BcsL family acetyltransferase involved in cellulose biosynthesis